MLRVALLLSLLLAAPALAATVSGASEDPVGDGTGTAAQDLVAVRSGFDDAAGTWTLTVRLAAPATTAESAAVHGILYATDGCPGTELGRLEGSTDPARTDQHFGNTPATKTVSADGREVTFSATAPELAGRTAGCATVSLSKGHPLDLLDAPVRFAAEGGSGPPPSGGAGDGGGGGASPPPATIALKLAPHGPLRGRRPVLKLAPLALAATVRVRLERNGRRLASGERQAAAGKPVRIVLRRTGRIRKAVKARAVVTASAPGATPARRVFQITLQPR